VRAGAGCCILCKCGCNPSRDTTGITRTALKSVPASFLTLKKKVDALRFLLLQAVNRSSPFHFEVEDRLLVVFGCEMGGL
jgi:hypothetical protein